jgi:ABC-type multidrug transport system ATPase subunit
LKTNFNIPLERRKLRHQNETRRSTNIERSKWMGKARNTDCFDGTQASQINFSVYTHQAQGPTGAGKTSLLDVLASRTSIGVVTGEMFVDGQFRDNSFQSKTGYVQQEDLHQAQCTVWEALIFSALLRQSKSRTREEKLAYVDTVIRMLEMESYSEAIVGIPGEGNHDFEDVKLFVNIFQGLNIEQRKRLTIAVEMVARPALLFFLGMSH